MDEDALIERATKALKRRIAGIYGAIFDYPSRHRSRVEGKTGKQVVILENVNGELARYKVKANGDVALSFTDPKPGR